MFPSFCFLLYCVLVVKYIYLDKILLTSMFRAIRARPILPHCRATLRLSTPIGLLASTSAPSPLLFRSFAITFPPKTPIPHPINRILRRPSAGSSASASKINRPTLFLLCFTLFLLTSATSYEFFPASRHLAQAIYRCARLMYAVILDAIEYKRTFAIQYANEDEKMEAYRVCHLRSAKRMLEALQALGGCYIKIGQHLASSAVIPVNTFQQF